MIIRLICNLKRNDSCIAAAALPIIVRSPREGSPLLGTRRGGKGKGRG